MNKRLTQLLQSGKIVGGDMLLLDTYNQTIYEDITPTISTRVDASNNIYIMEEPKIIEEGNYKPSGHSFGKVHNVNGISSTVMENHGAVSAVIAIKEPITICLNSKVNGKQPSLEHRIYDSGGISTAITTGFLPSIAEPMIGAMRGRNPEKPSERGISNGIYKQRLEMNENGTSNTITSVSKDNLVVEPLISVHPISHKHEFNIDSGIKSISPALRATDYKAPHCVYEPSILQVGNIVDDTSIGFKNPERGRIYSADGLSPTLNTCSGGGLESKIVDPIYNNREPREYTEYSPALRSERSGLEVQSEYRIRKLTPRECFRLMDVREKDIDKIQDYVDPESGKPISNSQQYKMAGNSIVVNCMYHIFRTLFCETENPDLQLTIFDML